MTLRKVAAALVVGAVVPVFMDQAADPYAERTLVRSWFRGAAAMMVTLGVSWALGELSAQNPPHGVASLAEGHSAPQRGAEGDG